ncbi:hypothetical protein [Absidia glauca]|uniref:SWIM-type domain-containing protein n=1 Tax=Absidia glauca TaxID=4829 RepID=A0A168S997_ABSGL|nr:hypothetical protein [Absidia glauca]
MYNFCVKHQSSDAWAYIYRRWYTVRSVDEHIPNAKSTTMIELHWRVLKRNHLYLNNQPRLEYLVYVIIQKQCSDLLYDYEQKAVLRRDYFQWERDILKEWHKHLNQDVSINDHATNVDRSVCGCPSFFASRFLICKHLVQASGRGHIRLCQVFIERQLYPPFIVIVSGARPSTNHPGRVNNRNHDNAIYIGSSDSEGAEDNSGPAGLTSVDVADEDNAGPAGLANVNVADEDVADEDAEGFGAGAAVADGVDDDHRGLLEMEVSLQTNRGRKREQAETYASRMPHAQAEKFRTARSVEGYLESVTRFRRRRRTMPRTYGNFNPYTYNL